VGWHTPVLGLPSGSCPVLGVVVGFVTVIEFLFFGWFGHFVQSVANHTAIRTKAYIMTTPINIFISNPFQIFKKDKEGY